MNLIFATSNLNKLKEIKSLIPEGIYLNDLTSLNFFDKIPEKENSIEKNAVFKANFINSKYNLNVFADDTGLEVEALNGEPGVYSARYAGEECDSDKNIKKLLKKLIDKKNRKAKFKTVIALILNHELHQFEGIVNGTISHSKKGNKGFGYDSVFIPEGYHKSFAELTMNEKNEISHRSIAVKKLICFLKN
ncbi:MAG: RdgB/HAM1 family non-canonical purine NTP pyrophosphatase [Bacteroidetes bacterium]|jgi:XTP/dITP diphosphohydrolase|nr:RdgB/HAM1 family non-canonical purine NTP pyrophosphatase [Bacteroidota bacterium]MDA1019423.1 RdgB/HAM1 family non-canonical purine NTP pyrophosphatase [Bacteroidota bacterium]|tara:strand:+ start:13827 stop:14399 length:573 start_codon:yes stop_codon:yes gene_type:complete